MPSIKTKVYEYIRDNEEVTAVDIAEHFDMPLEKAVRILESLLRRGDIKVD